MSTAQNRANGRKPIARHLDFPLKPGRKQAALVVEEAQFEIYKSFDEARCYLMANIDWIMKHFGDRHQVKREDIIIVSLIFSHELMIDCWSTVGTTLCDGCIRVLTPNHPEVQCSYRVGTRTWSTMGYVEFYQASRYVKSSNGIFETVFFWRRLPCQSQGIFDGPLAPTWSRGSTSPLYLQGLECIGFSAVSPFFQDVVDELTVSDAVLLAKLRIAPGESDPTLYP